MEINNNNEEEISEARRENLVKELNLIFINKPSSFGYKHDIEMMLKDKYITEKIFFKIVIESLSKEKRNNDDLILITSYLFFMQEFIKILKIKQIYEKETQLFNFLKQLSAFIYYVHFPKNRILMRYGDKGGNTYINLNGKVDVIIPNSKLMNVYEDDYLLYLASLLKYKEYYLINTILNDNFSNYPLIIYDDFDIDEKILLLLETIKINQKKISSFIKGENNEIIKKIIDIDSIIEDIKQKMEKNAEKNQKFKKKLDNINISNKSKDIHVHKKMSQKIFKLNALNEELAPTLDFNIISSNQLLNLFNFKLLKHDDKEIINCSTQEYITRINEPNIIDKSKKNIKEIKNNSIYQLNIYFYSKISSLDKGAFFGELALRNLHETRTATIITTTDCYFSYLNKKIYNKSLKVNTELNLKNKFNFFSNIPIFSDIPISLFYKNYYTHMSKHHYQKNKFVIKEDEKPTQIYLLNKGNYILLCHKNLNEITDLIFYFISKAKKYQLNNDHTDLTFYQNILDNLKESIEKEKKLLKVNPNFQKIFSKLFFMKISEMSCPDITGFEEIINKDGTYAFSVQANSIENISYSIDFNFYNNLYKKNFLVKKRHDYIIQIKLDLAIKRLVKIRNNIISPFFEQKIEDDISSVFSKEIENIKNARKINKRYIQFRTTFLNVNSKKNLSSLFKDSNINDKILFKKKINYYKISKYNSTDRSKNLTDNYITPTSKDFDEKNRLNSDKNNDDQEAKINNKNHNRLIGKINNIKKEFNKINKMPSNENSFLNSLKNANYTDLLSEFNLRKKLKKKNLSIYKNNKNIFTDMNNSMKGKKVDKSIKCYFDKKIKIKDSKNFTGNLRKKRKKLKLEFHRLNSIILNKKKIIKINKSSQTTIKKINSFISNNSSERLLSPKYVRYNMYLLTDKSINSNKENYLFNQNIKNLFSFHKTKDNKKEKIEEILKEDIDRKNNSNNSIEKNNKLENYIFKRDNYYKKNLERIKILYGMEKK